MGSSHEILRKLEGLGWGLILPPASPPPPTELPLSLASSPALSLQLTIAAPASCLIKRSVAEPRDVEGPAYKTTRERESSHVLLKHKAGATGDSSRSRLNTVPTMLCGSALETLRSKTYNEDYNNKLKSCDQTLVTPLTSSTH
ncbi:hypothetical protein NQZ68_039202 [Dissostichus eleginoides]|nr:hypothetical protein NQZ68_039202 [Dissostichus eleginoides]